MSGMIRKYRRAFEARRRGYVAGLAGLEARVRRAGGMGVDQVEYAGLSRRGVRIPVRRGVRGRGGPNA